ncbi:Rhodanese domain protein [Psychromonas ingrahamii 37]|uniref:Rhodanese domain protein n=1 Tax=Psychromonas ingrahamii (strain DSM 17664 / CCUG 51855 / 37) TaxID=357804 RepID=A1SZI2_PSYIN|nr:rhodanese-like domain-containing protein [Psychromonas ingrahamii]ABM04897.1 Rhodanese domain protein [Psychromonas ingrahamii 37]
MQQYIDFFFNQPVLSIAWIAIAVMLVQSLVKHKISGVKSITAQDAIMMINKQNAIIVDVRSVEEYKKGHILNAKNIPVSQIDKGSFAEIEKHKEAPIILVCASGDRSSGAAGKLTKAGFTQVTNLLSGMNGWSGASLPTTKK